ncbi:MAG: hypothetical protein GC159_20305 [Phycisphaera sp.]|nr:hypothetical protein [Phycisphaera sp.]
MTPIVLSTWSFGSIANNAAWSVLREQGSSLDAVEAGARAVEADPTVNSVGYASTPDRSGRLSLDASIMQSPSQCGAVAAVRRHVHVISIARMVMERTPHVMLAGEGADAFAESQGMTPVADMLGDDMRRKYEAWRTAHPEAINDPGYAYRPKANREERTPGGRAAAVHDQPDDTVGVLAIDHRGVMAGACSTSGWPYKLPGRVGDSPTIGHGLYVHPKVGAAVATGSGELVMGLCSTFHAVDLMRRGASPADAAIEVLQQMVDNYDLKPQHQLAVITLTKTGEWSTACLRPGFSVAVTTPDRNEQTDPTTVLLA